MVYPYKKVIIKYINNENVEQVDINKNYKLLYTMCIFAFIK